MISSGKTTGSGNTGEAVAGFTSAVALLGAFFVLVVGATAAFTATLEDAFAGALTAFATRVLALVVADLLVVLVGITLILQSHSAICKINLQKKASWIKFKVVSAFFIRWMVTTIAVFVAEKFLPGISCSSVEALLGASLLLGIINAFVRPFLLLLSMPFIIITMGLFIFVVNALLLLFVSQIIPSFHVDGFWNAFFGAIIISTVSWILSSFFRTSDGRIHAITHHPSIKKADARTIK